MLWYPRKSQSLYATFHMNMSQKPPCPIFTIKRGVVKIYNVDSSQLLSLEMPVLLASVIEKLAAIVEDGNLFYFIYHHLFL